MSKQRADSFLTRKSAYPNWVKEHMRWSDTDQAGHASNLAFGAFAETGRGLFLRRFFERGSEEPAIFLPAQITLNYLGELHWPADIDVGTGILAIGNSSFRFGQGLFEGDRCFGTSESVFVLVDTGDRRPRSIPDDIRVWLQENVIA